MKRGGTHDQAARARIAAGTRAAMADPAVRERISQRTRAGMARVSAFAPQKHALAVAWQAACPEVRKSFLDQILAPVCVASAAEAPRDPHGGDHG